MFRSKTLLRRRTLKRICKRQILEWPQLEPIRDRINNLLRTRSRCCSSNNYRSANKCFKWVTWVPCYQDLACLSNRWCQLCLLCKPLVLMFIIKLLRSSNASLPCHNLANSKLNLVNFKIKLYSLEFHNFRCLGNSVYNQQELILCFILLNKFSTMMLNNQRAAKKHLLKNLPLLKRIAKKHKSESSKILKGSHQIMTDLEAKE